MNYTGHVVTTIKTQIRFFFQVHKKKRRENSSLDIKFVPSGTTELSLLSMFMQQAALKSNIHLSIREIYAGAHTMCFGKSDSRTSRHALSLTRIFGPGFRF